MPGPDNLPLSTSTIDQLPRFVSIPPGAFVPVQAEDGPLGAIPAEFLAEDGILRAELLSPEGPTKMSDGRGNDAKYIFDRLLFQNMTLAEFTALVAGRSWDVGDTIFAGIYNGTRWTVRLEVILQNHFSGEPLQSSKVISNDNLHVIVPLNAGGTGVIELDLGSVQGHVQNEVSRLKNEIRSRFLRRLSLATIAPINCLGDSITHGQIAPQLFGGDRIPTGYGDGSLHEWTRAAGHWPATLLSLMDNVVGAGKIPVANKGFSGDRVGSAYVRHRFAFYATASISIISYGTNDTLFGTNNGINPELWFSRTDGFEFAKFTPAYRKFVYREVLRGALPICCAPYVWKSLVGYDGTDTAVGKIASAVNSAIKTVAEEIGAGFIDWRDIINGRPLATMCYDGVHLSDTGNLTMAAGIAAGVLGYIHDAVDIYGPKKLTALPHLTPMNGPSVSGAGDMQLIPNSNSLGKPFDGVNDGADLILAPGDFRYIFVRLHIDEAVVVPVGYVTAGGTLALTLDFGVTQGKERLNSRRGAALGDDIAIPAFKEIVNGGGGNLIVGHPGSLGVDHLKIQGPGYHIIQLSAGAAATILSGLEFNHSYGRISAAIGDPVLADGIADAVVAHALNPVFSNVETQDALNALGTKINALIDSNQEMEARIVSILEVKRNQSQIAV